ncbi:MAG: transposase [Thiohalocapsa sp.]
MSPNSQDGPTRKGWKLRLVRLLYQRGYTREQVLELFRILDWLLRLPEALEREFMHELIAFEEQAKMPYVTSIERLGREEGHKEGRQEGEALVLMRLIELKFGPPSEAVREQVNAADADTLLRWSERILTAQTLDDVLH